MELQAAGARSSSVASTDIPLVVDLDGTLLRSDLLLECASYVLAETPLRAFGPLSALRKGRAGLKASLARAAELDISNLPWNRAMLSRISVARTAGRKVFLATAAHRDLAEAVASHLDLFDGVFASDESTNLRGASKAELLVAHFGERGFDYAADATVDWPVWERARRAILVEASPALVRRAQKYLPDAETVGTRAPRLKLYVRAIRAHQWAKNLLLFVPMLAAHRVDAAMLGRTVLAFLAFSLCASSVYVLNDLVDLRRDRAHPTKRNRPFAAGTIPVLHGFALAPSLLIAAMLITLALPMQFAAVLACYYTLTFAYSLHIKRKMLLDVVTLACLYGLRILAGGAAAGITVSAWLGIFSIFFFSFLALVKRCAELQEREISGAPDPAGRGYRIADLPMLHALAAGSGMVAVLVFALYVNSDVGAALYRHPNWLAGISIVLFYWIGRTLLLTYRNEMHEDPVVFAVTDRVSLACGIISLLVILASLV
jgi:4-hydroxybenzoate polyprenyltransferase